jgi:serine/threonine protein phosphatase 1
MVSKMTQVFSRVYVIGDIHGRADLLDQIVQQINADVGNTPSDRCLTATLGDYVDRGPDSRGVLDRLSANPFRTRYIGLKGNHELLFEAFLRDGAGAALWFELGGLATLESYGFDGQAVAAQGDFGSLAKALRARLPAEHRRFLSSLQLALDLPKHFLCHAGIRPGTPLAEQREQDLLWIRHEFLQSTADFGKIVVHGHTPTSNVEIRPNRINVDTGAFFTGRLTCVVLEAASLRFLAT